MATSVDHDARGIVSPTEGLRRFRLDRHDPSPTVARFVAWYWVSTWDLDEGSSHTQHVLPHPAVNAVLVDGTVAVTGPQSGLTTRVLHGRGRALGVLFRPAGFRPFLGRPLMTIADRTVTGTGVLGEAFTALAATARPIDELVMAVDHLLAARVPADAHPCEATSALVEGVAADPAGASVEDLAATAGTSVRQLQRRFADHVGLGPKAVIRRYRLLEAAERVRRQGEVDWAALAAELRYSDQPHLVRDFRATFGLPPGAYHDKIWAASRS